MSTEPIPESAKRKGYLSVGEFELRIFEQVVEEHDQFAHGGGQSDERFFADREERAEEGAQDEIVTHVREGGHVEAQRAGGARRRDAGCLCADRYRDCRPPGQRERRA